MLTYVPIPKTAPREREPVNRVWALSDELEKGANGEGNAPRAVRSDDSPVAATGESGCRKMLALLGILREEWMDARSALPSTTGD